MDRRFLSLDDGSRIVSVSPEGAVLLSIGACETALRDYTRHAQPGQPMADTYQSFATDLAWALELASHRRGLLAKGIAA